ncbi:MAG: NADP-dependent malic enzyme [Planctomycetes bacterium]|nr:NADP-dependent malic enzyme [Planctomycetota bacterium]
MKPREPQLEDILLLHQGGKTRMVSRVELKTVEQLRQIYTPGVAEISRIIENDPDRYYDYTSAGETVAVVTNGTAVLGLGDVGVRAAMPVMEGKSVVLIDMVDVAAVPILVDTRDADTLVQTVTTFAPTFGAILLEDIAAPLCFEVESRLKETLDVPVFHDDQHGTAVVVLAALISALKISGKRAADLRVVMNGAGAAGSAVARFLLSYGAGDVVLCDRTGAIYEGRREHMNPAKEQIARETNAEHEQGPLAQVMRGKDVFIGVSAGGLVSKDMVRSMAPEPIVFAMANPTPEIWPHEAMEAGALVAEDGRNINNALGFPGIFRGTLDARASRINEEMKIAASTALARQAPEGELVPDFMDRRVHRAVADAVAEAARQSGVARR